MYKEMVNQEAMVQTVGINAGRVQANDPEEMHPTAALPHQIQKEVCLYLGSVPSTSC